LKGAITDTNEDTDGILVDEYGNPVIFNEQLDEDDENNIDK
jgi:hypothetical protein